jgi:hypothetical protein
MSKILVSLACCAFIAPLALAKDSKQKKHTMGYIQQAVTVTAPSTLTRVELGEVAEYQPAGTLVVRQDGPGRFVLNEPGHVFNRRGEMVSTALRPGSHVQVYFAGNGASKTIDHVVVY